MDKYQILSLCENQYDLYKCINKENNNLVAIKKVKENDYNKSSFKKQLEILKQCIHPNILQLKDAFLENEHFYLVFDFIEATLLDKLQEKHNGLDAQTIKIILYQMLKALSYLHSLNILHRSLRPESILISPHSHKLQLCGFGSSRTALYHPNEVITDYIGTRWYRSPELILKTQYGKPSDIWAVGCMMGELIDGKPLFPGEDEIDQLYLIQKVFVPLSSEQQEQFIKIPQFQGYKFPEIKNPQSLEKIYEGKLSDEALNLMLRLLDMDPKKRITAEESLLHSYFNEVREKYEKMQINTTNKQ